jgi:hypothetical protein
MTCACFVASSEIHPATGEEPAFENCASHADQAYCLGNGHYG